TGRADDMATELRIADSRAVAEVAATELQALGIEVTPADADASITISNPEDSRVLHISYQASDPSVARVGSELTASAYLAYRSELNAASRQVARTSINDEIAVLQDRLAVVEDQLDRAVAGSSARLVAEVEQTSVEGELEAQQRALADLSTLSIDAATVFDSAQEPTSADGLGALQILVGALAGGLVLGVLAAWILTALGIDPERIPDPRSFSPPTRSRATSSNKDDDGQDDADSPFDDSDNRDPLELLRALDAVEADPALTLNRPSPSTSADEAAAAEAVTEEADEPAGDFMSTYGDFGPEASATAQTLPPLSETDADSDIDTDWATEPVAGTDGSGVDEATGLDEVDDEYDPFDPNTLSDYSPVVSEDSEADGVTAASPLLAQLKGETDSDTADTADTADTEAWPGEDASVAAPDDMFASLDRFAEDAEASADGAGDAIDAETEFETNGFDMDYDFSSGPAFDPEPDPQLGSNLDQASPFDEAELPAGYDDPFAEPVEMPANLAAVENDEDDSTDEAELTDDADVTTDKTVETVEAGETAEAGEPSLSSGDPRDLDPGPASWEGPFVGPTTWEQLSAMAAATGEQPSPDTNAIESVDAANDDSNDGSNEADAGALPATAAPGLVASKDVDQLFDRLSQLGAAGPVAVLSLSDHNPAAGLTAGFELADELRAVGANVLLIDARLENPVLDTLFDDGPGAGLAQVMTGHVVLAQAVRNLPGLEGLDLLTVGTVDTSTAEHLTGAAFQRLLAEARLSYHSIVVIGDAVLPSEPGQVIDIDRARALASAVDGVIVGTADPAGTAASEALVAIVHSLDAPTLQLIAAQAPTAADSTPESSSV
ncbi:MAG: hypothetical protein AAFO29_09085, partial [Actinomycetota bacterium]